MAIGKSCDRCGAFYKRNENRYPDAEGSGKRIVIGMSFIDSKKCLYRRVDLCDKCISEAMNWLNMANSED